MTLRAYIGDTAGPVLNPGTGQPNDEIYDLRRNEPETGPSFSEPWNVDDSGAEALQR